MRLELCRDWGECDVAIRERGCGGLSGIGEVLGLRRMSQLVGNTSKLLKTFNFRIDKATVYSSSVGGLGFGVYVGRRKRRVTQRFTEESIE